MTAEFSLIVAAWFFCAGAWSVAFGGYLTTLITARRAPFGWLSVMLAASAGMCILRWGGFWP